MHPIQLRRCAGVLTLCLACAQPAVAAIKFSFSGTFAQDDENGLFSFTLTSAGPLTLATTSFAGSGGFVPWLHVWDQAGLAISGAAAANS